MDTDCGTDNTLQTISTVGFFKRKEITFQVLQVVWNETFRKSDWLNLTSWCRMGSVTDSFCLFWTWQAGAEWEVLLLAFACFELDKLVQNGKCYCWLLLVLNLTSWCRMGSVTVGFCLFWTWQAGAEWEVFLLAFACFELDKLVQNGKCYW